MAPILLAAHGDAEFNMDLPGHRGHSPDGPGPDWRVRVAGGSASIGTWNAEPAFGATRARRGAVAAGQSSDPVAHRHFSIHVFRRDEVLLHEGLLDKNGRVVSRPRFHIR